MTRRPIVKREAVHAAYQPIVDLATRQVVAFEALARFDPTSGFANPAEAFDAARQAGPAALAELDQVCIGAAVDGAVAAALPPTTAVFINVLPTTFERELPAELVEAVRLAGRLRVVVEVTEVDVMARPAEMLAFAAWARRRGFGVAVDDVGPNPQSLSLLPLLRPDVIKLDRSILVDPPNAATGRVLSAVLAAAESTGAAVLAEGIETEEDVRVARSLGASYGQGWHLGRPGPLPDPPAARVEPFPLLATVPPAPVPKAPFELVSDRLLGRDAPYDYLLAISHDLEDKAARTDAPIMVATFQDADRFTGLTKQRYEALARHASLIGAVAEGLAEEPAPGVRGAHLHPADPIRHDWNVVVLAPHFAAALIARDLTASGPVRSRRYDYAVTHTPSTVTLAAQSLLDRLVPIG